MSSSTTTTTTTEVRCLRPQQQRVRCRVVVLEGCGGGVRTTKDGRRMGVVLAADASAAIEVVLWGTTSEAVRPGDIVVVENGCVCVCAQCPSL